MLSCCQSVLLSVCTVQSRQLAHHAPGNLTVMSPTKAELQEQLQALQAENQRLASTNRVTITARVPADLRAEAKRVAAANGDTLQDAVEAGLRWYLDTHQGD